MAITTLAGLLAAPKYDADITANSTFNGSGNGIIQATFYAQSVINYSGAITGLAFTASGTVPTGALAGFPTLPSFNGMTGYITKVTYFSGTGAGSTNRIFDRLFVAGTYAYNSGTTVLTSQPSFASRMPNGDYGCVALYLEVANGFTGTPTITVTYTNQAGVTGRTTGAFVLSPSFGYGIQGAMFRLPLQAGDTGVQKIESISTTGTASTAGNFNIVLVRPLTVIGSQLLNTTETWDWTRMGLPQITDQACLMQATYTGGSLYTFGFSLQIAVG
jgi:hypothetical protein